MLLKQKQRGYNKLDMPSVSLAREGASFLLRIAPLAHIQQVATLAPNLLSFKLRPKRWNALTTYVRPHIHSSIQPASDCFHSRYFLRSLDTPQRNETGVPKPALESLLGRKHRIYSTSSSRQHTYLTKRTTVCWVSNGRRRFALDLRLRVSLLLQF